MHGRWSQSLQRYSRNILFFAALLCALVYAVDPRIIYHGYGIHGRGLIPFPAFFKGADFFGSHLLYPGGLLDYATAFCTQLLYFRYAGSLLILLGLILLSRLSRSIAQAPSGFMPSTYIPALLVFAGFAQYSNEFTSLIGLVLSLAVLWLYRLISARFPRFEIPVFALLFAALYYTAGVFSLIFGAMCVLFDLLNNKRYVAAPVMAILSAALYYIGDTILFDHVFGDDITRLFPWYGHEVDYRMAVYAGWALYLYYPVMLIVYRLRRPTSFDNAVSVSEKSCPGAQKSKTSSFIWRRITLAECALIRDSLLIVAAVAMVYYAAYDEKWGSLLKINSYARQGRYDDLLAAAKKIPLKNYNTFVNHEVNKALYFKGELATKMFDYPQNVKGFVSAAYTYMDMIPRMDTYCRLGFINHAERQAFEALEMFGEYPAVLKYLVYIKAAKGDSQAARVFLNVLKKDIIHGKWAKETEAAMDKDPSLGGDPFVAQIRAVMNTTDYSRFLHPLEDRVADLVNQNKNNEMAYEYLMSLFLLTKHVDKIGEILEQTGVSAATPPPRYYREALFIDKAMKKEPLDAGNSLIGRDTFASGTRYLELLQRFGRNVDAAKIALAPEFGDSYFYYFSFSFSGAKR